MGWDWYSKDWDEWRHNNPWIPSRATRWENNWHCCVEGSSDENDKDGEKIDDSNSIKSFNMAEEDIQTSNEGSPIDVSEGEEEQNIDDGDPRQSNQKQFVQRKSKCKARGVGGSKLKAIYMLINFAFTCIRPINGH